MKAIIFGIGRVVAFFVQLPTEFARQRAMRQTEQAFARIDKSGLPRRDRRRMKRNIEKSAERLGFSR